MSSRREQRRPKSPVGTLASPDPTGTRERILDVAERLFARHGFDGTSLRTITAEAAVNLAAVHYHFGSKDELLRAILRRHIEPINRARVRALDQAIADAEGGLPHLAQILDAFLRPAIEYIHGGRRTHLMRLVAMLHSNPEVLPARFFHEVFDEVIQRFRILEQALPHLERDEIIWRFHFMIGAMMQCVSDAAAKNDPRLLQPDVEPEIMLQRLLGFVIAGFEAPATVDPAARGRSQRSRGSRQPSAQEVES